MVRNALTTWIVLCPLIAGPACAAEDYDGPPIHYSDSEPDNAVARLQAAIDTGEAELTWNERRGWLDSVLEALEVPVESQTLVFSKTSLQVHRISPKRPRAVYFNDDVYVGWTRRGDLIEVSAVDPRLGAVFYALDQTESAAPRFVRDRGRCLACHNTRRTRDVPGFLVRSVRPDVRGHLAPGYASETSDPTTPFGRRYGGWYVTGETGSIDHLGNAVYEPANALEDEPGAPGSRESLDVAAIVGADDYLSPNSEIVALMLLEHQVAMHNAITRATYEARLTEQYDRTWNEIFERPSDHRSGVSRRRVERAADELIEAALFCGEQTFDGPIGADSVFAGVFQGAGRERGERRSLRDLDLHGRLFRYPCSYLLHTESFSAIPDSVLDRFCRRLGEVLRGDDVSEKFAHLTATDRAAIREILLDTTPAESRLGARLEPVLRESR